MTRKYEFTFDHQGSRYCIDRETGEVRTWIVRTQKASGWQRVKSARRIKAVTNAAIKAFSAELKADERSGAAIFKAPAGEAGL